jgi:hypothetical protein
VFVTDPRREDDFASLVHRRDQPRFLALEVRLDLPTKILHERCNVCVQCLAATCEHQHAISTESALNDELRFIVFR